MLATSLDERDNLFERLVWRWSLSGFGSIYSVKWLIMTQIVWIWNRAAHMDRLRVWVMPFARCMIYATNEKIVGLIWQLAKGLKSLARWYVLFAFQAKGSEVKYLKGLPGQWSWILNKWITLLLTVWKKRRKVMERHLLPSFKFQRSRGHSRPRLNT